MARGCCGPCEPQYDYDDMDAPMSVEADSMQRKGRSRKTKDLGVKVEAQFSVGEYDIVVLSAKDSNGLDTWLRREESFAFENLPSL